MEVLPIWVKNMETKGSIRRHVLEIRNQMSPLERSEKSRIILSRLRELDQYKQANMIFAYVSFGSEVMTQDMITCSLADKKRVAVPKIKGTGMEFYEIQSLDDLQKGYFGIMEPWVDTPVSDPAALIIMPGVAFDPKRSRIGYGKGFYDTYLKTHSMNQTVAIAFQCQIVDRIPPEPHDKKPNHILTESKIYQ